MALAVAALAHLAPTASAAPAISGTDGDVWNASNPVPTYVMTGSRDRATIFWQVPTFAAASGRSPATVRLEGIPDGTYRLLALEPFRGAPDISERTFRVDVTPPVISIRQPVSGASFAKGAKALADYSCEGAATCEGSVAAGRPLATSRTGPATLSVKARDDAGNETTAAVNYVVAPPARTASTPPKAINARALRPRIGVRVTSRRPVLRWRGRAGARLYNVQVFRLRGGVAKKVLSAFPRRSRYRFPARRLAFGERYVWRVWPHIGGRYAGKPLGLSYFDVRRPPAGRRSASASSIRSAATRS